MPVSADTVQFSYTGDGVTTVFPFPSRFLSNSDIIVGVDGSQVLTGFTVTGEGNDAGGNVTFAAAPLNGLIVTLIRAPAISQLLDFVNNQTVLAENLDNGLDKLTIISQYLEYLLDRTIRLSRFDTALSGDYDLQGRRIINAGAPVDADDLARLVDLQNVVSGGGNVPSPTGGQVGYRLQALAAGIFGWVAAGSPSAPDGTAALPGYSFASEPSLGMYRVSAGHLGFAAGGAVRVEMTAGIFKLSVAALFSSATLTAGTDAQGQGAITTDQVTITSAPNNPSGATLPLAQIGRRVIISNRGANPVNVYPAAGQQIMPLAADIPVSLAAGQIIEFFARNGTQWEVQQNQPLDADLTQIAAVSRVRGMLLRGGASAWEGLAPPVTVGQVLQWDGTDAVWGDGLKPTESGVIALSGSSTNISTAIPAGTKRITVWVRGASLNGNGYGGIQVGTGGAFVTSGYVRSFSGTRGADISNSNRFVDATSNNLAANTWDVRFDLRLVDAATNTWHCTHTGASDNPVFSTGSGVITLAGALDRIRYGATANSFDGGAVFAEWSSV